MELHDVTLLRERARIVRTVALVSIPVIAMLTWMAFSTGWIGGGSQARILLPPTLVLAWVVWIGLGARWALAAVPEVRERVGFRMSARARKAYLVNVLFVIVVASVWSVATRSIEAVYLASVGVFMLSFLWFGIGTLASVAAVGSVYAPKSRTA